ncbi:hypothetical protein TNCV_1478451 [Trichonephila clavipes]|nr:hypothetical protein TNCV_1478451 [Trichonephila clavipes]
MQGACGMMSGEQLDMDAARISKAKRRKRVTRDMSTLKNSMLELAAKFDDNYNTGLIKSFMFGLNKTEIKTMTDILSRYKFRDSHVPSRYGGTLNSRRAASSLVRLEEGKERFLGLLHNVGVEEVYVMPLVLSQIWGRTEQNHTVTCMVLKAKANDRRKILALSRDELRGP